MSLGGGALLFGNGVHGERTVIPIQDSLAALKPSNPNPPPFASGGPR